MSRPEPPPRPRTSRPALLRYALLWLVAGSIAVGLGLSLIRTPDPRAPVRRVDPIAAVVASGCVLTVPEGLQRRHSRPAVSGPPAAPARIGAHASAPTRERLVGALRRGVVVVQYQPNVAPAVVDALRRMLRALPAPVILTPDRSGMPFVVAATAWRRLLGCTRTDRRVVDALRAFASRYSGRGPDA